MMFSRSRFPIPNSRSRSCWKYQIERITRRKRPPFREQLVALPPHAHQLLVRQRARCPTPLVRRMSRRVLVEFGRGSARPDGALGVERSHYVLHEQRFGRQGAPRTLALGVLDGPTLGDEPVECVADAQLALDGKVREIVQGEERGMLALLLLPRLRTVRADALQNGTAVLALGQLDLEGRHSITEHTGDADLTDKVRVPSVCSVCSVCAVDSVCQSYSSDPCTQMNDCRSIMSRGARSD